MKKSILLFLVLTCSFALVACSSGTEEDNSNIPTEDLSTDSTDGIGSEEIPNLDEPPEGVIPDVDSDFSDEPFDDGKVYVADAAIYRGIVNITETEGQDDNQIITLTQAEGSDFGAASMTFLVNEMTTGTTDIIEGKYFEVFYGRPTTDDFDYSLTHDAIAINDLGMEEMVNFNGKIVSMEMDGNIVNSITLLDSDIDQEVMFNVSEETQIYLSADELKEGDCLNIYHKGMLTRSIPAQGVALEIRYFESVEREDCY